MSRAQRTETRKVTNDAQLIGGGSPAAEPEDDEWLEDPLLGVKMPFHIPPPLRVRSVPDLQAPAPVAGGVGPPELEMTLAGQAAQPALLSRVNERCQLTPMGNGERLVGWFGDAIRFCHDKRAWFIWDGRRWAEDRTGRIERLAKATVRFIYAEAALEHDDDRRNDLISWAHGSQSRRQVQEMIAFAAAEVPVRIEELDREPFLFNTRSGTVDLRTRGVRTHDPKDLLTKTSPVAFDPQAACPRWHAFLRTAMAGDEEMIGYLQRAVGYAATASIREQVAFILWGGGANGKSTFLEVVKASLGEYAVSTKGATIMAGARPESGGSPDPQIIALVGSRMVIAVETDEFGRLNEGRVKSLTGGDTISARDLHAKPISFQPTFKLFLATNHKPQIRGTDNGIWRRLHLIPWTVAIPPEEQDKDLKDKLLGELPGILAWIVAGAVAWYRDGLMPPAKVKAATDAYRAEMDTLAAFFAERCELGPTCRTGATELYREYRDWAEQGGERPMSQVIFGQRLGDNPDLRRVRDGNTGRMVWIGLGLRSTMISPLPTIAQTAPTPKASTPAVPDRTKVELEQLAELFN
jgi:putative DNA primase/helicase